MTSATHQNPSDQYDWKGQVTESIRRTPSTNGAPPTGLQNEALNGLQGPNPQRSPITRLEFENLPGHTNLRDNHGNEIHAKAGNIPAITCNGQAQTLNLQNAQRLAQQGLAQIPPEVLSNALGATRGSATIPNFSGSVTYQGESPLTTLCNAGKAAGILQR